MSKTGASEVHRNPRPGAWSARSGDHGRSHGHYQPHPPVSRRPPAPRGLELAWDRAPQPYVRQGNKRGTHDPRDGNEVVLGRAGASGEEVAVFGHPRDDCSWDLVQIIGGVRIVNEDHLEFPRKRTANRCTDTHF